MAHNVKADTLQLGDWVNIASPAREGFDTCVVINMSRDDVTLFRPFVHTDDVAYSGRGPGGMSLTPYLGSETFEVRRDSSMVFELLRRGVVR